MNIKLPILIISLILFKFSTGQNEDVPIRNIFEGSQKENITQIKYSTLRLLRGEFPIYVEKNINQRFSALAGIGLTFPDIIGNLLISSRVDQLGIFPSEYEGKALGWLSYGLTGQLNYFLRKEDLMDGPNIGVLFGFRNHRGASLRQNYTIENADEVKGPKINVIELGVTYGFQRIVQQKAVHEIVIGLGARLHSYDYIKDIGNYIYRWEKGSFLEPTIFLSYRFGSCYIK